MTFSQRRATIAFTCTIIATVCAAVAPQLDILPPKYKVVAVIVSILGTIAGSVVTLFNQSLSSEHVSVPVAEAIDLGLIRRPDAGYPLEKGT
jgi:hypothetical protein